MRSKFYVFLAICFVSLTSTPFGAAVCYFPDYLQGEFVMQSSPAYNNQIQYTKVNITAEGVSLWGFCHQKIGNGLYLIDGMSSVNGTFCLRCFHITAKSQNVVIIRTTSNPDKCFMSLQTAEASCPKNDQPDKSRQLILFKTKEEIRKEYCPINGKYKIQYKQNKPDYAVECSSGSSQIDNCVIGSQMNIRFRGCQFENHEMIFECLGSWDGPNQQRYLALFDTGTEGEPRPQYRCGLYKEDAGSNTVHIAFSSDSTCITDLQSSRSGYETLLLTKEVTGSTPPTYNDKYCRFPNWTQGRWELVTVDGQVFMYTDTTLFKTYTFHCIEEMHQKYANFPPNQDEDKFALVHGRTQCGEEFHACLWLKKRGANVFEFQLGSQTTDTPNGSLCSPLNFQTNIWITQGRKDHLEMSPCPILGEYIGTLPNMDALCAKLWSDCNALDTMYYMVSDCAQQQIYEGRYLGENRRRVRQTRGDDVTTDDPSTTVKSAENSTAAPVQSTTTTSTAPTPTPTPSPDPESTTSSEVSVGSYYIENRNFGEDLARDVRPFDRTFLPVPLASSTSPPYIPYRREYPQNIPPPTYRTFQSRNGYYEDSGYRNPYPNPSADPRNHSYQQTFSNQMYIADSPTNPFQRNVERRTIIALPPIQLPSPMLANPPYSFRRNNVNTNFFKEREYRCLGQWQENGFTYTFTQRKDIGTYECFVGTVISNYEFSVREAGKYCERNIESLLLAMKLARKSSCLEDRASSTSFNTITQTTPAPVTTAKYTVPKRAHTTRSWKPITNLTRPRPTFRSRNTNTNANGCIRQVPSQIFILSNLYLVYKFLHSVLTNLSYV